MSGGPPRTGAAHPPSRPAAGLERPRPRCGRRPPAQTAASSPATPGRSSTGRRGRQPQYCNIPLPQHRLPPPAGHHRPGRSCQDAIAAIFWTVKGKAPKRLWVLDTDLAAAFDRIDHDHLMSSIGQFPARGLIRGWLKAGVIDRGRFAPTEEGTPQGGVISPVLMNVALHGLERAAGCQYRVARAGREPGAAPGTPVLVRYADDFIVRCHDDDEMHQVRARPAEWLEPRGLRFNEEKTRAVHLEEGFDILGYTVRRTGGKLIIKPSTGVCKRLRARLRTEVKALHGSNAEAVLHRLIPIVRGRAAYCRAVASTTTFTSLDHYMWRLTFRWVRRRHRKKSGHWIVDRYFGQFHPSRRDRWVFGDRDSGAFLPKCAWTGIVRHYPVKGGASPDDPALAEYGRDRRRRKAPPPMDKTSLVLAVRQQGLFPLCKQHRQTARPRCPAGDPAAVDVPGERGRMQGHHPTAGDPFRTVYARVAHTRSRSTRLTHARPATGPWTRRARSAAATERSVLSGRRSALPGRRCGAWGSRRFRARGALRTAALPSAPSPRAGEASNAADNGQGATGKVRSPLPPCTRAWSNCRTAG
ncbi:reverse transcriptase domain-containing protein [Kitasatospora sp. NPDC058218]|uniref:reverse transcriptase domain-containing protein n=1 Tax=Kitasatospora sp. NPDC058218 TaxID=3346385 RepID=UPI0036D7B5E5